jgi:hypothetical protein
VGKSHHSNIPVKKGEVNRRYFIARCASTFEKSWYQQRLYYSNLP